MRKYSTIPTALTLIIVGALAGCGGEENGEPSEVVTLSVNGSTTVTPIMQSVAEVYEAADLEVSGTGSGDGITALIDGRTDVAMASRKMKDKEKEDAAAKGVKPVEVVIARDGIAIVVHPSNTVSGLTLEQVKDIYLGKITNWKQLGGPDAEIVPVTRDSSSGTFEVFEELVMDKEPIVPGAVTQNSNGTVRTAVAGSEGAVGYVGLGYVDKTVKALAVDGVVPSEDTVNSGAYKIARDLNLYYPKGAPQAVLDLVKFVLSKEGQKIVADEGFIPL
ncbi:MAG TPA: PstS family phosphate ABC transporter substrate-binding protein [bacterium]|nr:PstS family phosphate ABC transporter substrate-binding protein [bacterium]